MTRAAAIVATLLVLAVAGCGGQQLSDSDSLAVARANADIACAIVNGTLTEQCDGLGWVGARGARDAADRLISVYRANPDAKYNGRAMSGVLRDAAAQLDGYLPDVSAALRSAEKPLT